jgi:hypothetical protein
VVLNAEQDSFYAENLYMNFGELGENIKKFVDEYVLCVRRERVRGFIGVVVASQISSENQIEQEHRVTR